jgi:phage FluMu protein Com
MLSHVTYSKHVTYRTHVAHPSVTFPKYGTLLREPDGEGDPWTESECPACKILGKRPRKQRAPTTAHDGSWASKWRFGC